MRIFTFLFMGLLVLPLGLSAQSTGDLLQKLSVALGNEQYDYAVSLFRQSAEAGVGDTEMFYWTRVDKKSDVAPKLARELATYYKERRNYDKAYLFYKEILQYTPNDVATLTLCAEMEVFRGNESSACRMYEQVLALDADNLAGNIFLGNYLYLKAELEKKKIEEAFKKITVPTRMQYARYKESLNRLLAVDYDKAKIYLLNVVSQFPSTEVVKTLEKIKQVETEIKR